MTVLYEPPESLTDTVLRYCPGCGHGIAHRLIAEVIDELGVRDHTVTVASVGCSVYAFEYFNTDVVQSAHGRAPAVATGVKRVRPDDVVFTYQGDGDLAAIGLNEVLQAATRAEKISVFFINNAVFGMTGGQMAPTTLLGQKTTTSVDGRTLEHGGYPFNICELMNQIPGVAYLARETLIDPRSVMSARRSIMKAFRAQIDGLGFSLVELVSTCPTWWHMKPLQAMQHVRDTMLIQYPLGVFKDPYAEG
ncbi:thiamine pyrophosphate-dependent enzyme [bacterium]|nr:thiamine pyrophosphate-dependent enzyme [bacterium]